MAQGGRIVVPARVRKALGFHDGDKLEYSIKNGAFMLTTRKQRMQEVVDKFHKRFPPDPKRSLSDELIADRRAEQAREDAKDHS